MRRLTLVLMTLAALVLVVGSALAAVKAHHHNSGHSLAAQHMTNPGVHQLDHKGHHTVSAEVRGGKIATFKVKHETKGDIAVKKYKSRRKLALLEDTDPRSVPAQTDVGTVYIAYAYVDDDGNEEYYWFPYAEILDGDTGAVEYVPLP